MLKTTMAVVAVGLLIIGAYFVGREASDGAPQAERRSSEGRAEPTLMVRDEPAVPEVAMPQEAASDHPSPEAGAPQRGDQVARKQRIVQRRRAKANGKAASELGALIRAQEVPKDRAAWEAALARTSDADVARLGADVLTARAKSNEGSTAFDGPLWKMTIRALPRSDAARLVLSALQPNVNSLQQSLAMRAVQADLGDDVRERLAAALDGPQWLHAFSALVNAGDDASMEIALRAWSRGGQRSVVLARSLGPALDQNNVERIWALARGDDMLLAAYVVAVSNADERVAVAQAPRLRDVVVSVLSALRPPGARERTFAYHQVLFALHPLAEAIADTQLLEFLTAENENEVAGTSLDRTIAVMREALR